jgi:dimethylhistidine N-methyltransferase
MPPVTPASAFERDVLDGLLTPRKTLLPKYFYDARGAALFEAICETPEYYVTRAELEVLRTHQREIALAAGDHRVLLEYGSGAGLKVRLLLDAMANLTAYVPIDISAAQLVDVADSVQRAYPRLHIHPLAVDFTEPLTLPETVRGVGDPVAFFPGSTIGNFEPADAALLLGNIRDTVGAGGAVLLGVDRRKSRQVLEAAYNDRHGVTAAFNLNLLERINRELAADFAVHAFEHVALWNESASRIEMHLVSRQAQEVQVAGVRIRFAAGESIRTECSYKYDEARLTRLAARAGLRLDRLWTDTAGRFWVVLLRPA